MSSKEARKEYEDIACCCLRKYEELRVKRGKPCENEWTVMAAICRKERETLRVVSVATGTKSLGADALRKDGCVLRDCHAEVLAKRAFRWYLMDQIDKLCIDDCASDAYDRSAKDSPVVRRRGVEYYMFVSQAPCGDASIPVRSPTHELTPTGREENVFTEATRLRKRPRSERPVKLCVRDGCVGEEHSTNDTAGIPWKLFTGAKPVVCGTRGALDGRNQTSGILRMKPGRGVPSRSVSCSDKLARWLYVGIQGALLSIVSPFFYLDGLVAPKTALTCELALKRALIDRLREKSPGAARNSAHGPHYPHVAVVEISERAKPEVMRRLTARKGRPSPYAIVWAEGHEAEVVQSKTGLRQGTTRKNARAPIVPSKCRSFVCSASLFEKFRELCCNHGCLVNAVKDTKALNDLVRSDTAAYGAVKATAEAYQDAKQKFFSSVFPCWPRPDASLMGFCLAQISDKRRRDHRGGS
eukprot:g3811.t1